MGRFTNEIADIAIDIACVGIAVRDLPRCIAKVAIYIAVIIIFMPFNIARLIATITYCIATIIIEVGHRARISATIAGRIAFVIINMVVHIAKHAALIAYFVAGISIGMLFQCTIGLAAN